MLTPVQQRFLQALNDLLVEFQERPYDAYGNHVNLNVQKVDIPPEVGVMVLNKFSDNFVKSLWTPAAPVDTHNEIQLGFRIYPEPPVSGSVSEEPSIGRGSRSRRIRAQQLRQLPVVESTADNAPRRELPQLPPAGDPSTPEKTEEG